MKKLLFLFVFLSAITLVNAQPASHFPLVAGDTLTGTADTVQKIIPATAGYSSLGVNVNAKLTSGTIPGKVYLAKSYDGITYAVTDSTTFTAIRASTYQTTAYTHTAQFEKVTTPAQYYRIWIVSAATAVCPVDVWYSLRRTF